MASLFASPDIAALVAAFPPPLPTKTQHSLVRSYSGNGLSNSSVVIKRFRTLLETGPDRIKKADLPSRLDIERCDWLFDCYDGSPPIRWNGNGTSIVPAPLWTNIIKSLSLESEHSFVAADDFAKNEDIPPVSTDDLIDLEHHGVSYITLGSGQSNQRLYLASRKLLDRTKQALKRSTEDAADEKLDLSRLNPDIPTSVLKDLADEVIPMDQLEFVGETLVFVPPNYHASQEARLRAHHETRIQGLLDEFEHGDFVQIVTNLKDHELDDATDICNRYTSLHRDVERPIILNVDAKTKVVVLASLLERTLHSLKEAAADLASHNDLVLPLDERTKSQLAAKSLEPVLAAIVLELPDYASEISSSVRNAMADRDHKLQCELGVAFHHEVYIPATLYAAGVTSISDPKLKQSLDKYVSTHFRHEVIPTFTTKHFEQNGSVPKSSTNRRELQKYLERVTEAKTMGNVVNDCIKYAKKKKWESPKRDAMQQARRATLEQKASQDIQNMTRGSDILQNLVWILLSVALAGPQHLDLTEKIANGESETFADDDSRSKSQEGTLALFLSPGKDTGRMIKQYSVIARSDSEIAKRLTTWREKLKTASETKQDLDDMKALAASAVAAEST